jgi:outer membrane protein assembly factor BamB/mono/diheme cytochrome c family protein
VVSNSFVSLSLILLFIASTASGQTGQWTTFGHDPRRSGYADDEHAFTRSSVASLGLQWKTVVPNEPLFLNGLTAPLLVRGVRTAAGAKNLLLVAAASDHVFALDADTGDLLWNANFPGSKPRPPGEWLCPAGLNATPIIDTNHARVFVISSDGKLHSLGLSDGSAAMPAAQFVPSYSKMWSLNYASGVLYASLSQDCNHAKSSVVAMDPDQPGKPVVQFFSAVYGGAGVWGRGGVAIGYDGFIYGSTGDAPFDVAANEFGDTVLKLAPHTLKLAGYYTPDIWQYLMRRDLDMGTTTPVIFRWRGRVLAAVGGKEGAIYVTDTATMSGPDHHKTAYISPRYTNNTQTFEGNGIWGEMSAWKDGTNETWLYVPTWGEPTSAAQFPISYGAVKNGSVMAFQVKPGADGKPVLKPVWISTDIAVPDPVAIAGGVAFVLGTGEDTQQVKSGDISQLLQDRETRSHDHAILHALDALTGKELWSSADMISGWTHFSGLAIGDGKVFVTTHDGGIYAFGLRGSGSAAPRMTILPAPAQVPAVARKEAPPAAPQSIPQCGQVNTTYQRCAMCHGANGKGMAAMRTPDFTDSSWQSSKTDKDLIDAITNGTDHGMPAFGGELTAPEIDQLIHCMVRGLTGKRQEGSPNLR